MPVPSTPAEPAASPEDLDGTIAPAVGEHTEYYNQICDDLIAMAHDMARQIHDAFNPHQPPRDLQQHANAFARLACTILLAQHLTHPNTAPAHLSRPEPPEPAERPERDPAEQAEHPERPERTERRETLATDLREIADIQRDLATRPIPQIIAEIRQALGLAPTPNPTTPNPTTPNPTTPNPPPGAPPDTPPRPILQPAPNPRPRYPLIPTPNRRSRALLHLTSPPRPSRLAA